MVQSLRLHAVATGLIAVENFFTCKENCYDSSHVFWLVIFCRKETVVMCTYFVTQKSCFARASPSSRKYLPVCVFVCAIIVTPRSISAAAMASTVELADIVAGIKHSESLLRDYELRYKSTKRWLYKEVHSKSEAELGKTPPKILRFEPKTEEEKKKAMISQYTWRAKGTKFFYARDFIDNINDLAHSEKHAFNNKRHLQLNNHSNILTGVVDSPMSPYRGMPTDVIRPKNFFAELQDRPIIDWLNEALVTIAPSLEMVAGKRCYVIECANKKQTLRGRLWISPDSGFRPMKMEYYLSNGAFCSYAITEMKEVAEGLWLPMKGTEQWHVHPPFSESLVLYSSANFEVDPNSVKVNSDMSDEEFVFTFPQGTQVHDRLAGLMYVVGDAEYTAELMDHFLSASEHLDQRPSVKLKRPQESSLKHPTEVHSQSDETEPTETPVAVRTQENGHSLTWLVAATVVSAGFIGAFVLFKKRKKRSHNSS